MYLLVSNINSHLNVEITEEFIKFLVGVRRLGKFRKIKNNFPSLIKKKQ